MKKFTEKKTCLVRRKAPEGDVDGRVLSKTEARRQGRETLEQSGGEGVEGKDGTALSRQAGYLGSQCSI